ncbi:hypothetical protein D3C78_1741490 [compost metagenome]
MAGFQAQHISQKALQHGFDNAVEPFAGRSQGNASGAALEQHRTEVIFKHLDLLAHRALGQVQLAGGASKTAGAHHCFKGNQGVQRGQVTGKATHAEGPVQGMAAS